MSKAFQLIFTLALFVLAGFANAFGDEFSSRPITLVSPYAAGGGNDFMARTVARGLANMLKQTVVVENKAGASGTIGLTFVSRARPDGYTIVMGGTGSVVLGLAFEAERLKFDPQKEKLAPVALVAKELPVLMVRLLAECKNFAGADSAGQDIAHHLWHTRRRHSDALNRRAYETSYWCADGGYPKLV